MEPFGRKYVSPDSLRARAPLGLPPAVRHASKRLLTSNHLMPRWLWIIGLFLALALSGAAVLLLAPDAAVHQSTITPTEELPPQPPKPTEEAEMAPAEAGIQTESLIPKEPVGRIDAVHGRARGEDGYGISGVKITLRSQPAEKDTGPPETFTGETNSEGYFQIDVNGGLEYTLIARHEQYATTVLQDIATDTKIDVLMKPGDPVLIRVLHDPDGYPVPEASIKILGPHKVTLAEGQTNLDGTYRLTAPPLCAVTIWADHPQYAPTPSQELDLKEGHQKVIVFQMIDGRTVTGVVSASKTRDPIYEATVSSEGRFARTDAAGRYRLDGLPAKSLYIRATAPGCRPGGTRVNLQGTRKTARRNIRLSPGCTLEGMVTDEAGQPLPNVPVRLLMGYGTDLSDYWHGRSSKNGAASRTDETGRFHFDGIDRESWATYRVASHVDGCRAGVSGPVKFSSDTDHAVINVTLYSSGRLTGIVRDDEGNPLEGAHVSAVSYTTSVMQRVTVETETDAEGNFLIEGLPEASYTVHVRAEGFVPYRRSSHRVLRSRDSKLIEIKLDRGVQASVLVRDPDGNPVQDAKVQLRSKRAGRSKANTDANGLAEFETAPPGPYDVRVSSKGHAYYRKKWIDLPEEGPIEVTLKPRAMVRGHVVSMATGDPITSFQIRVTKLDKRSQKRSYHYSTRVKDDEGAFEFALDDGSYAVTVFAQGYAEKVIENVNLEAGADTEPLLFELTSAGSLEGLITDENGNGIAADIYVRTSLPGADTFYSRGSTELDGYFHFGEVPIGQVDVLIASYRYPYKVIHQVIVTPDRPGRVDEVLTQVTKAKVHFTFPDVTNPKILRRPRIRTTVKGLENQPLSVASRTRDANGKRAKVTTNTRRWTWRRSIKALDLSMLPEGRYEIRATLGKRSGVKRFTISPGVPLDLVLPVTLPGYAPPAVQPGSSPQQR